MTMVDMEMPGGPLATRPLHFFWIVDCSGSMAIDGKIQALNTAVREAIPHMRDEARENPNAQVLVRAVKFSNGAQWHVSQASPVDQFEWVDLEASGVTDMGHAFRLVTEQLRMPPMPERALPPVLALISDGQPTDDAGGALQDLMALPWGKRSVRVAVAIGADADVEMLQRFIGTPEILPVKASNPEALVAYIKWVSTAVLKSASAPASQPAGSAGGNVPVPSPPPQIDSLDVW